MKKANSIFIVCLWLLSSLTIAQQMPHFTQYMMNDFFLNPAVAGTKENSPIRLTLRNQWANFNDAPKTQTLSFHTNYFDNMGVGGILVNDKTGPLNQTGVELAYAYQVKINDDSKLSLGLSGKVMQYVMDERKLTLDNPDDMAILGIIEKTVVPNAGFGAYYYTKNFHIGLSVPQLMQTAIRYDADLDKLNREIRHYFINAGYIIKLNDDFSLEPGFLIKTIFTAPTQFDVNLKTTYKDAVWLAFSYRNKESVMTIVGFEVDRFSIGYAFDFTLSNIRRYAAGSHEVMLGINIDDKDLKKNKKPSSRSYK
jgi:type IX secretion system PorP/SprF family membrane protein